MKIESLIKMVCTICLVFLTARDINSESIRFDYRPDSNLTDSRTIHRNLGGSLDSLSISEGRPRFLLDAWNGEARFGFDLCDLRYASAKSLAIDTISDGIIGLVVNLSRNESARLYERLDGNLEWEMIFAERPDTNRFSFEYSSENLKFVLQDTALVSEKLKATSDFPDSTIYSWVAYHDKMSSDYVIESDSGRIRYQYRTGIAFIIYRPLAYDAVGDSVWCTLEFDTSASVMTIDLPESFLDNAVYPVVVDPTIGNTGEGAWTAYPSNWLLNIPYYTHDSPTGDAQVTKGYIYSY